ncbi:4-carboxy-4-hydroxy-2-oxoadipate aldolase/oxaloacetate decarboxylase [Noviherbaspirillum sedimenti]|uniref:Putative 4-hydroxy-4-methyl-2-oxoglutarate aldolase n=1 Tax=Noviherbaspirillum sedimenti TaxID=2320865 RepID=A0A3A3G3N8_9BURK|nr:4-carboxy-4-hydroxy-2-oxoadipate aldolase/oxaloacetate decarboxylase [Noviherbaspirillum sedimenti]RJG03113.1 4-carboxy-4-hydroxy-2-oxoadipate aldolase/oxaloacetate decarboxylase [Noviherbaspirillum sedimenti]
MSAELTMNAAAKRELAERVSTEVIAAAQAFDTATLHEAAGKIGALPSAIKPVSPGFRIAGPAVTVHAPGGDNLWLHRAIYMAQPGDVLVVHVNGVYEHGYWGEVMSTAAKARKLGGLVIDGCVRDGALLAEVGFPVFARGLCIRGTGKDFAAPGFINHPTLFGDVTVHAGDLVVGDGDGVVVIPREAAQRTVEGAQKRADDERGIMARLEQGESSLSIYGWY